MTCSPAAASASSTPLMFSLVAGMPLVYVGSWESVQTPTKNGSSPFGLNPET